MTHDKEIQELVEALDGALKYIWACRDASMRLDTGTMERKVRAIRGKYKTLLSENKRYRGALEVIGSFLMNDCSAASKVIRSTVEQALNQSEEDK